MKTRTRLRAAAIGVGVAGIVLAATAVTGCSASSDSASAAGEGASSESSAAYDAAAESGGSASGSGDSAQRAGGVPASAAASAPNQQHDISASDTATGSAAGTLIVSDRQIIRTADVTLKVTVEPEADEKSASAAALADAAMRAAHAVRALASQPGAYVSGSDGHGATITVTLRIPAGNYDSVMGRLADIGTVTSESESTDDVTGEIVDVASRVKTMQASVDRLRALMTDANDMKDVIAIESELTGRQADLESLQRRQAELSDQVALSTISVTVNAETAIAAAVATPEPVERSAFVAGVMAGWHGLMVVGRGAAAVLGALLPFLVPIALLGAGGWFVARRIRRARPAAAPSENV